MSYAACTVLCTALSEKSEVLAKPRCLPTYTEIDSDLSRLCSTVSTAPLREVTDKPLDSETSTADALAPTFFAIDNASWAMVSNALRV